MLWIIYLYLRMLIKYALLGLLDFIISLSRASVAVQNLSLICSRKAFYTRGQETEQSAFVGLKSAWCQAPIFAFPNFEKYFILYTDAPGHDISAVLMQFDFCSKHRTVGCASCLLNKAEQNYDVTNSESLVVILALRHFRELILGYRFHVYIDHHAVTEIF